jgi:hypothetical protein
MRYLLLFLCLFLVGCKDEFAIRQLRNDSEVAKSALVPTGGVNKDEALSFIAFNADAAANKLDPEKEILPTTTSAQIIQAETVRVPGQENTELKKISTFVSQGPSGFGAIGWGSILGFSALALGAVGKFMGPPFNLAGSAIQMVAQRCLPNYEQDKKTAVAALLSTDKLLTSFDDLFSALDPETKAKLVAQCGGVDPLKWAKGILKDTQQDLGAQDDVATLMSSLKNTLTTDNGDFAHSVSEVKTFIKKRV